MKKMLLLVSCFALLTLFSACGEDEETVDGMYTPQECTNPNINKMISQGSSDLEATVHGFSSDTTTVDGLRAEGEAQAITTTFSAIHAGKPSQSLLAYQYLRMLPNLAKGESNKVWIIPSELNDALKGLGSMAGAASTNTLFSTSPISGARPAPTSTALRTRETRMSWTISARTAATSCGPASGPATSRAGSPGSACTKPNTKIDTATSTGMVLASRLIR